MVSQFCCSLVVGGGAPAHSAQWGTGFPPQSPVLRVLPSPGLHPRCKEKPKQLKPLQQEANLTTCLSHQAKKTLLRTSNPTCKDETSGIYFIPRDTMPPFLQQYFMKGFLSQRLYLMFCINMQISWLCRRKRNKKTRTTVKMISIPSAINYCSAFLVFSLL